MGNMSCSDMVAGAIDVVAGIIEEQIRTECLQKRALVPATEKQGFIQTHSPLAQGQNDPFVSRRRAGGDQSRSNRTGMRRKALLKIMQGRKETLERTAGQRLMGSGRFMGVESGEPSLLRDTFGFIAENHGIAVKCNPQFGVHLLGGNRRQNGGGGNAMLERGADGIRICGKEQLCTERLDVGIDLGATGENRASDFQAIVFNRIEYAQSGIRTIAGQQDDFDTRTVGRCTCVQGQKFSDQRKRNPLRQDVIFVFALVFRISGDALGFEYPVTVFQME